jgi:hypothetical protein
VATKSGFQFTASNFTLVALDSDYFLHVSDRNHSNFQQRRIEVRLFKVDVSQLQCTAMDIHHFGGFNAQVVVDSVDPHKFLICYLDRIHPKRFARKFRLADNEKLEIDDEKLDLDFKLADAHVMPYEESYKYAGNSLSGRFCSRVLYLDTFLN